MKALARRGEDSFDALMEAVKVCSLGQITHAFFEVGRRYRLCRRRSPHVERRYGRME